MRALFIAQGALDWASSRFRAWWLADSADWIDCIQAGEDIPSGYDAYILQKVVDREIVDAAASKGKLWLDWADPMHLLRPAESAYARSRARGVVCSSRGLAAATGGKFIPDRMLPSFHPTTKQHTETDTPLCLWFGYSGNRGALLGMALAFMHAQACGARFKLRILDDGPRGGDLLGVPTEYRRWQLHTFHDELLQADIVLNPEFPGEWGKYKSNNKSVSAWWAGVYTNAGGVEEFARQVLDPTYRKAAGIKVREVAEQRFDITQSVGDWWEVLNG